MLYWNLHQAHLKEVGLMQILANHDSQTFIIGYCGFYNFFVKQ